MNERIALVTGGSGGIGRAIATALAQAGFDVAVSGRDRGRLAETCDRVAAHGRRTAAIACDLRSADAAEHLLRSTEAELGGLPTTIVNNAGTAPTARFDRTSDGMLEEVFDLHVRAPFRLLRTTLAIRAERGETTEGCMLQLASSAGLRGYPFTAAYSTAKHAMVGMTRALAAELGPEHPIRAYAVCPGFVDTEITQSAARAIAARGKTTEDGAMAAMAAMNRICRMHRPEEVGKVVARLCRERPSTGCVYDLDCDPPGFLDAASTHDD